MVNVSGWLNVALRVVTQSPRFQLPLSQPQLDIKTVTDVRFRGPAARTTRSPNSLVCWAWNGWLGTFPGTGDPIESYTTTEGGAASAVVRALIVIPIARLVARAR